MLRSIFCAAATLALSGCATLTAGQIIPLSAQNPSTPTHTIDKNYTIGQEGAAFVGEPIVRIKDYWVTHRDTGAFRLPVAVTYKFRPFGMTEVFPSGTTAQLVGYVMDAGTRLQVVVLPGKSARAFPMLVADDGQFTGQLLNMPAGGKSFVAGKGKPVTLDVGGALVFPPSTVESVSTENGYTNFEIIYAGSNNDSVNLIYREYTPDDMARAAFTQNLTYSRSQPTIRFRNIRINVLSADNESIHYIVQDDGLGAAPVPHQ